jgi:DNA replication protein
MPTFKGFPEGKSHLTPLPAQFFHELLQEIDNLAELKLILYVFWRLEHMEGAFRCLRRFDLAQDKDFMSGLGKTETQAQAALDEALDRAVKRGALLKASLDPQDPSGDYYFLNSPKGRAAIRAIQNGRWSPLSAVQPSSELVEQPPNIFQLYEENIGPLTPMLADALKEAEDTYPAGWIEDAIRIAVDNNKRNWRYATAILERWRREGRDARKEKPQDRQDSAEARRRYVEGEFSDFIEH